MLLLFIVLPAITAFISLALVRLVHGNGLGWLLSVVPATLFITLLFMAPAIAGGARIEYQLSWFPAFGVQFSLFLDGLNLLFALLVTGIGVPIVIYSNAYFDDSPYLGRYYFLLFTFMASMLGVVLANNFIVLFIFWELTSICSFLLIGLNHEHWAARSAAVVALYVTGIGGLCLLTGILMLGSITGHYTISTLELFQRELMTSPLLTPMILLLLMGALTKSAQFPFHFWLPGAMQAPTPVSAYLHSATLVQLGIYLLARLHAQFHDSMLWFTILSTVGIITMLTGVVLAVVQRDMKLILAYTTITALGSLVFSLAGNQELVIKASVAFLLIHGLYKANLFMAIGDIQHQTGTRLLSSVSGLWRTMPITFMAVCVAAAAMAGLPPLLGFYVKELVYEASLAAPIASTIFTFIVVFANMMMATIAFVLVYKPFMGKPSFKKVDEANYHMSVNALLLAILTMVLSFFTGWLDDNILSPAAKVILGHENQVALLPNHDGITPSLLLTLITMLGAAILFYSYDKLVLILRFLKPVNMIGPLHIFDVLILGMQKLADVLTKQLQRKQQSFSLAIMALAFVLMLLWFVPIAPAWLSSNTRWWIDASLCCWMIVPAVALLTCKKYITGLIWLGVLGLGLALFMVLSEAPDVAMTQMLVETLIVILVVSALYKQRPWPILEQEKRWHQVSRGMIALVCGLLVFLLLMALLQVPFESIPSQWFIDNSLLIGKGRNVVNVILVDFRALDTLGELMVIIIAALGVMVIHRYRQDRDI